MSPADGRPLSYPEMRHWLLFQRDPESSTYNNPLALRMRGTLDTTALQRALDELVRRHEALRTVFPLRDGVPVAVVEDARHVDIDVHDLRVVPVEMREAELARRVAARAATPFQLQVGPVFRVDLFAVATDDHVLLLSPHHVIADAWAAGIMVSELNVLYERALAGGDVRTVLPPPPAQCGDFARRQHAELDGPTLDRLVAYWRERLADVPPLALDTDRPRREKLPLAGLVHHFELPSSLFRAAAAVGRQNRATPFMVFLAAYTALLARLTGETDVAVGSPLSGRSRPEDQETVGCFVNVVVFRTDVSGDPSFRELLARVRATMLGAFAHQDLPFEKLVSELNPRREPGRHPYFQAMLTMQPAVMQIPSLPGLDVEEYDFDFCQAVVDVSITLDVADDALRGMVMYDRHLFDASTIERLVERFATLLSEALRDPDRPVSELPVLTADERAAIADWERIRPVSSPDRCLDELVAERAAERPAAVAVVENGGCLTYGALDAAVNRLANRLVQEGVGPEVLVGVLLPRSAQAVVAVLAVLRAGGAYVPLDPTYPATRLAYMVHDASPAVVVTTSTEARLLPDATSTPLLLLDTEQSAIDGCPATAPDVAVDPDNLAYVIYTSGSTGEPKGVAVTHANVVRLLAAAQPHFDFGVDDRWAQAHALAFDFSVWEVFGALCSGGRLVLVPPEATRVPEEMCRIVREEGVTTLSTTPSAFPGFAHAVSRLDATTAARLPLRTVVFGGEALRLSHLAAWSALSPRPRARLVNMYGITETTVHVTYHEVDAATLPDGDPSIGSALSDLGLRILDATGARVPVGVAGELHIAGAGCARGYLGRPALTAERFVPDIASASGGRMYRSGDLGRWLPDGTVAFLGRADDQVEVRGFRIEPAEVERALGLHPKVEAAAVRAVTDDDGHARLVGYVVPAADAAAAPDAEALRTHLVAHLPEYMVPQVFVTVDTLPLTPSGKLDRRALPVPDPAATAGETSRQPADDTEATLAAVFAEVLGVDKVGVDDDFFMLGGDSILSIRVAALADAAGIALPPGAIFAAPTVAALAREAVASPSSAAAPARDGPPPAFALVDSAAKARMPADVEDAYPLTDLQTGMLFHSSYSPGSRLYHDLFRYTFTAPWDQGALGRALDQVVQRHAALRTTFDLERYGEPVQLVHRAADIPFAVEDLRRVSDRRRQRVFQRFFEAEADAAFAWSQQPPVRFFAHRLTDDSFDLTISMHHALLDGWSVVLLFAEWARRYAALLRSSPSEAEPLRTSYARFVELERAAVASSTTARFWEGQLDGLEPCLVAGAATPRDPVGTPGSVQFDVDRGTADRLVALARAVGSSAKSPFLAAHVATVAAATGRREIVTGVVAHGRPEETDGDRLLGLFLNTLPFRVAAAGLGWLGLLSRVHDIERACFPHRRYPMARLVGGERGPRFDWLFNFTNFHVLGDLRAGGVVTGDVVEGFEVSNFPLQTNVSLHGDAPIVELVYDRAVIGDRLARSLLDGYRVALAAMATDPEAPARLPLDIGEPALSSRR